MCVFILFLQSFSLSLSLSHQHTNTHISASKNCVDFPNYLHFGAPLSGVDQIVLLQVIAHMENFARYEGIFRKSGSKQRVDQLVLDLGEKSFEAILFSEAYKPHDFASMLKQYFSDLPEPLLLKRHIDAYTQTAGQYWYSKVCEIVDDDWVGGI